MNFWKKISLSFLSFLLLFTSFASYFTPQALAQDESTWYNQPFTQWYAKVYDEDISGPTEIFGERYTAAQVQWIIYSLISFPLNADPETQKIIACFLENTSGTIEMDTCGKAIINKIDTFKQFLDETRTTGNIQPENFMAVVLNKEGRQFSGIGYLSNMFNNIKIVKEVYAQGFGYNALDPIQKYWTGSRNIAYALIVFITIIFSFMIMFRIKISPQIVISVQSALPKVFIALILATFSYAIAGFAIDLMYVFGGLLAALIKLGGFVADSFTYSMVYKDIFPPNQTGLYFLFHMIFYDIFFLLGTFLNMMAAGTSVIHLLPTVLFSIMMVLVGVWIFVLSIVYTFKMTWVLIKTLISVYASIIFAPLQFVLGAAIPSLGFGNWFKKLMADLLVFPLTGAFMFFAWRLMWTSWKMAGLVLLHENILSKLVELLLDVFGINTSWFDTMWVPEILGFGQATAGFITLLMSFGIIVALPKIPDILKALLMGEKFAFGTAIGEAWSPIQKTWGATLGPVVAGVLKNRGEEMAQDQASTLNKILAALTPSRFRRGRPDLNQPSNTV